MGEGEVSLRLELVGEREMEMDADWECERECEWECECVASMRVSWIFTLIIGDGDT